MPFPILGLHFSQALTVSRYSRCTYESVESWPFGEVTTDLVFATASAISESAYMGVWNNINETRRGYAIDADYAEWMPEALAQRGLFPKADCRRWKNGSISLNTADFDHLMVTSSLPAVLGNMPSEELIADYEKVAFLGQVPVDVIGRVTLEISSFLLAIMMDLVSLLIPLKSVLSKSSKSLA